MNGQDDYILTICFVSRSLCFQLQSQSSAKAPCFSLLESSALAGFRKLEHELLANSKQCRRRRFWSASGGQLASFQLCEGCSSEQACRPNPFQNPHLTAACIPLSKQSEPDWHDHPMHNVFETLKDRDEVANGCACT